MLKKVVKVSYTTRGITRRSETLECGHIRTFGVGRPQLQHRKCYVCSDTPEPAPRAKRLSPQQLRYLERMGAKL